jgi:electron transport complex protein RnfG
MKIFRLGLLLLVVGFISSVLLGYVYMTTQKIIAARQKENLIRQQKEIFPEATDFSEIKIEPNVQTKVVRLFQAVQQNKPVGFIGQVSSSGYGGEVLVLVGITPAGIVEKVRILKENETPGLGKGIVRDDFLGQFSGKDWSVVKLRKDKGEIESLTGASRSSRAVTGAVQELGRYLQSHQLILSSRVN